MLGKLFSQTAIYGGSLILSRFLNYLLTPFLTRIMGTETFGEVSLYYGMIPFANTLLTMGLTTGYFRFAAKCTTEQQKRELFSTLWIAVSTLSLIFGVVLCALSDTLNYTDIRWYMIATAAIIVVDNINAMPLAALRQEGRAGRYMAVNLTSVVVNVILCVGFYTLIPGSSEQSGWVMVANVLASLSSLILLLPTALRLFVGRFSKQIFRAVTRYSLPLMLAGVMGVASDFVDRQMMNMLLPKEIASSQIGIYGAVAKIATLMIIFRQIYTLGAEPFFMQNFSKEEFKTANAAAMKYFIIAGLAIFLVIVLFQDLFAYILGGDYRVGMDIVPPLLLSNLLMEVMLTLSFWYKQVDRTDLAIWITLSGLAVSVVMNFILIPQYSYVGAAWTHLASSAVMVALSYILGQRFYRIEYDLKRILLYFALALVICVISRITSTFDLWIEYSTNILLILCYIFTAYLLEWKKLKL